MAKTVRELAEELFNERFASAKKSARKESDLPPGTTIDGVEEHSRGVATAAEKLAPYLGLNPDEVYIAGLLHDIGKTSKDWKGLDHGRMGMMLLEKFAAEVPDELKNKHWLNTAARIAMTHTWYAFDEVERKDYFQAMGKFETEAVKKFMRKTEINDIDRLIQLVDNLVGAVGVMTISDRFCDILVRHEPADASGHLKALYNLKQYFDAKAGMNIYELFREEIIKNALQEPNELAGVESASDFRAPE